MDKYPDVAGYVYGLNRPIDGIDRDGLEWTPTFDKNNKPLGYRWVAPEHAVDENGKLKPNMYKQAIFFSKNYDYDPNSKDRPKVGQSTAYVFKEDGSVATFDASTIPAKPKEKITVPEGGYWARYGLHKKKYPALRMSSIGKGDGYMDLPFSNPANDNNYYALGVNIHKPLPNNFVSSTACFNIDYGRWKEFISIFKGYPRNEKFHINVSRTYAEPMVTRTSLTVSEARIIPSKINFRTKNQDEQ